MAFNLDAFLFFYNATANKKTGGNCLLGKERKMSKQELEAIAIYLEKECDDDKEILDALFSAYLARRVSRKELVYMSEFLGYPVLDE